MVNNSSNAVPVVCSKTEQMEQFASVENVYKDTQRICSLGEDLAKRIVQYDDSKANAEYFAIDLKTWFEIDSHVIDSKRIGVGRNYSGLETIVFIQVNKNGKTKKCKSYILFSRDDWIELRRSRGEFKHQKMQVSENGTIWIGKMYEDSKIRVFVKEWGNV